MKLYYTDRFRRSYRKAPVHTQRAFDKQLTFFLENHRHPSLRAKKYDRSRSIWQARVNGGWRFYFTIEDAAYYLLDIIPHPK